MTCLRSTRQQALAGLAATLLTSALACSVEAPNDATGGASSHAGESAGGGAGALGGGGASVALEECSSDISWSETTALDVARDHHGTFVIEANEPHLYVAGGTDYKGVLDDVIHAPISEDGSVGAWSETTALPFGRSGFGIVTRGRHVVLIAGRRIFGGLVDIPDVLIGTTSDDGSIPSWTEASPLPAPRFHLAANLADDRIFVSGGLGTKGASTDEVFTATLDENGTLSAWKETTPLSRPRSHHASWVHAGWLYVAGGLDGNPAAAHTSLADVERAPIKGAALGAWEALESFNVPLSANAANTRGACVHLFGGIENGLTQTADVRRATLLPDGKLEAWKLLPTALLQPRSHVHQAPIFNNRVYYAGGSVGLKNVTNTVAIGSFVAP